MDFTVEKYVQLLSQLRDSNYSPITYYDYSVGNQPERFVILRHDVDLLPQNSLRFAEIESSVGMKATYYFRAVPESLDEGVVNRIHELGHEIGYHYESLTTCGGDVDAAYKDFCKNLEALRKLAPIRTICMHGSPWSSYDSRDIWKKYNHEELGICGEPYLTADFSKLFYLTDTGRRWDGHRVSVRDKVRSHGEKWHREGLSFHSTDDIIRALREKRLPGHLMITTHPQRWNDMGIAWLKELLFQNVKNVVKGIIVRRNER